MAAFSTFVQENYGMKRITQCVLALIMMACGSLVTAYAQSACTRDGLKGIIGQYFSALEAHNPSSLPLAAKVKFTENGVEMPVGEGFWKTAGKTLLKRDLIDTYKCGTHSNVVIEEKYTAPKTTAPAPKSQFASLSAKPPADGVIRPILYGVRLKVENQQIIEIESFVARETEFAFNAASVLETKDQDWESIIPAEQRSSRLAMIAAADDYYDMFTENPQVRTPFATVCDRWENGFQTTKGGGVMGGVKMTALSEGLGYYQPWPAALPGRFGSRDGCSLFAFCGQPAGLPYVPDAKWQSGFDSIRHWRRRQINGLAERADLQIDNLLSVCAEIISRNP
jgi:hypothetical protein